MAFRTYSNATLSSTFNVVWMCSKCHQINQTPVIISSTGHGQTYGSGQHVSSAQNMARVQASFIHKNTLRDLISGSDYLQRYARIQRNNCFPLDSKVIGWKQPSPNYYVENISKGMPTCTCSKCGNKEIWSRRILFNKQKKISEAISNLSDHNFPHLIPNDCEFDTSSWIISHDIAHINEYISCKSQWLNEVFPLLLRKFNIDCSSCCIHLNEQIQYHYIHNYILQYYPKDLNSKSDYAEFLFEKVFYKGLREAYLLLSNEDQRTRKLRESFLVGNPDLFFEQFVERVYEGYSSDSNIICAFKSTLITIIEAYSKLFVDNIQECFVSDSEYAAHFLNIIEHLLMIVLDSSFALAVFLFGFETLSEKEEQKEKDWFNKQLFVGYLF